MLRFAIALMLLLCLYATPSQAQYPGPQGGPIFSTNCAQSPQIGRAYLCFDTTTNGWFNWNATSKAFVAIPVGSVPRPNSFGSANNWVSVKDYGAQCDGVLLHDGVWSSTGYPFASATSTSPSAPAVTTTVDNSWIVTVMGFANATLTPPSTPTQRVAVTGDSTHYGMYEGDQVVTPPGSVAAQGGTLSGSVDNVAGSVRLVPNGGAITSGTGSGWTSTCKVNAGSACTLTVPSQAVAGDLLLEFVSMFDNNPSTHYPLGTAVTSFNMVMNTLRSSAESGYVYARVMKAGDTSFQFSANTNGDSISAFMVVYKNATIQGSTISSATANFGSSDVGKPICVSRAGIGNFGQVCGTITSVVDATDVIPTIYPAGALTGQEVGYATDDTAAYNSAVTALMPGGGTIYTPALCGLTSGISLPTQAATHPMYAWKFLGAGSNRGTSKLLNTVYPGNPTSGMWFLTTSGVTTGGITVTQNDTVLKIEDMAIIAGVGENEDGGGGSADGINASALQTFGLLDGVFIQNWSHDCVNSPDSGQPWSGVSMDHSMLSNCGNYCDEMAGNGSQDITIEHSMLQTCGGNSAGGGGIYLNGQGVNLIGDTIQDQSSSKPNIVFGPGGNGNASSGVIEGIYMEGTASFTASSNAAGFTWKNNHNSAGALQVVFSAAGTALPAATGYAHFEPVCVSDETSACTLGNTYASGGSNACLVQSNGINWKVTGAGCY